MRRTQLALPCLLRLAGALFGDQRVLLLLLAMLTRTREDREEICSCPNPGHAFEDELAAAIHPDKTALGEVANGVATCCASQVGRSRFDGLGIYGAAEQLRWLLPQFGIFAAEVDAPRSGHSALEEFRDADQDDDVLPP